MNSAQATNIAVNCNKVSNITDKLGQKKKKASMENFFIYLLLSDIQGQNTLRHRVLKILDIFASSLCYLNKPHPESSTHELSGSQQSTAATKHKETRFFPPKSSYF